MTDKWSRLEADVLSKLSLGEFDAAEASLAALKRKFGPDGQRVSILQGQVRCWMIWVQLLHELLFMGYKYINHASLFF